MESPFLFLAAGLRWLFLLFPTLPAPLATMRAGNPSCVRVSAAGRGLDFNPGRFATLLVLEPRPGTVSANDLGQGTGREETGSLLVSRLYLWHWVGLRAAAEKEG